MKFIRGMFLAACLWPAAAFAWTHGISAAVQGTSVVGCCGTNAFPYMNFVKQSGSIKDSGTGTSAYPGIYSVDGYPNTVPAQPISGSYAHPASYFGHERIQFSGQGSFQLNHPVIVYNGGAQVNGIGGNSGSATNLGIIGKTNAGISTSIEFAFGALVTSVSNNGGLVQLNKTSAFGGFAPSGTVQVNNFTNLTGQFAYTKNSADAITLTSSTYSASIVPGTGSPGTAAEVILSLTPVSWTFPTTGPYGSGATQMSALIICKVTDIDGTNPFGLQAGYQVNADLVTQIKQLNPAFVRFMDESAVIQSTEGNFTYRPKQTNFSNASGGAKWYPDYWIGAATNNGSDTYTGSNPAASGGGAYADGEVFQAQISGSNTTPNPLVNLNSRGPAPIFTNSVWPQNLTITGSPTTGDTIAITATGSYIPTGAHTVNYTVKSSDTTNGILGASLTAAITADTTFAALTNAVITGSNPNGNGNCFILYNVNAGSGTTFSVVIGGAGTEIINFGRVAIGALANNQLVSMTYNAVMGGFIMSAPQSGGVGGGLNGGMPIETMAELANRANVGAWFNIPLLYSPTQAAAMTMTVAGVLNSSLSATFEVSNEVWNFNQSQTTQAQNIGLSLGFPIISLRSIYSFYALQVRQSVAAVATAWASAGRSSATLNRTIQWQEAASTSLVSTWRLAGGDLTTSNAYYAAKGGPGGTAGTTYTATGQRPADVVESGGYATYWYGQCFGQGAGEWSGLLSNFTNALQAGADYASGNSTLMANAINAVYNDVYNGTLGTCKAANSQFVITNHVTLSASWYTVISSFDASRATFGAASLNTVLYEGANQVAFATTAQNFTTSPANLAAQFATNGWDTTPYGASNTIVAQQEINLWFAFLNDQKSADAVNTLYTGILAQNPGRKVRPAQFQYDGPAVWALFPGDIYTTPFKTYNAISSFNAVAH